MPDTKPEKPYQIEFFDVLIQINDQTKWTLRQCGKCMALVLDSREAMQGHVDWHGQLRTETTMASMGLGGLGL